MKDIVVLPLSKDLWIAPEYDEKGEIKPRADTVNAPPVVAPAQYTQDQLAMLMASMQKGTTPTKE